MERDECWGFSFAMAAVFACVFGASTVWGFLVGLALLAVSLGFLVDHALADRGVKRHVREEMRRYDERVAARRESTVTTVPPGTIARMRENPAVPSPELRAAVERARIRRTTECPGGEACEC